ncbi:hypothetical protein ACJ41O_011730 [Fusarium nematophilum]
MFGPVLRIEKIRKSFSSPDAAQEFPLHAAICNNDLARVRELIESSIPFQLEEEDASWGTPLHVAVFCDNLAAVDVLLRAGADALARCNATDDRADALTVAAREGNQRVLRRLWQHMNPDDHAKDHRALQFCLVESAIFGQVAIIADLLDWWGGWTRETKEQALNRAAGRWKVYVVDLLLSRIRFDRIVLDMALSAATDYKFLLHSTNEYRIDYQGVDYFEQQQLIRLLLDAGANMETTHNGFPLVIWAAKHVNLVGALSVLLGEGADPNTADTKGRTALHHLGYAQCLHQGSFRRGVHEAGIRLLLRHKASVCQQDASGATPIHEAAHGTNLRILQLELSALPDQEQRDAAIKSKNHYGTTLLHYAAAGAKLDIVEYLLLQGLDVNCANSNGWTPLMCALVPNSEGSRASHEPKQSSEAIRTAQLLLFHGADPLVTTAEGWTPLHCISLYRDKNGSCESTALIAGLISRGASVGTRATFLTRTRSVRPAPPSYYWGYQLQQMIREPEKFGLAVLFGYTPLHFAAAHGSIRVAKALLEHGADPSCRDARGNSAAKIATHSGMLERLPEVRDEMVRLLTGAGEGSCQ